MKKLLIVFTILGAVYTTNSFAQTPVPIAVSASFKSSFTPEQEVNWTMVDKLYKAEFLLDNHTVSVFYNEEGSLVASARDITLLQLPLSLQTALKNDYSEYRILTLFEVDNNEGITYYVTATNDKKSLKLKSTTYGEWETYQKSNAL